MLITIFLTDILYFWDKLANMTNHIIPIYKTYKCCLFFSLDHVSPRELLSVSVDVYQLDRVPPGPGNPRIKLQNLDQPTISSKSVDQTPYCW